MSRRTISVLAACVLVVATAPVAGAAAPKCRGLKATVVGTSGSDQLEGTEARDVVAGLGGNDLVIASGGDDVICSGAGSDEVYGGEGSDVVLGQAGNDVLGGDVGNDKLVGAGGSDYLEPGPGDDSVSAGVGFDEVAFRNSAQGVQVDLAAGTATGDGSDSVAGVEMVTGSAFDDALSGAEGDFEIFRGLAGNDTVDGRGGFDQLLFDESQAPVTADAEAGTATGDGNDTIASIESFVGSEHGDTLRGDANSNDIYGFGGDDVIDGRDGNDYLLGHEGNDDLVGGPGVYDMIDFESNAPAVTIDLTAGTSMGEGNDEISGFEIIGGSESADRLTGSEGDELFYPYGGDDTIDGRGGFDLVLYDGSESPIQVDLAAGTAQGQGSDSLSGLEGVVGSPHGDVLTGDGAANLFVGGGGGDSLSGADGDDYFDGGPGNDQFTGGAGEFDMINFFESGRGIVADLREGTATGMGRDSISETEMLLGSIFDDVFRGDDAANYFAGREGGDRLIGRGGDDTLDGGAGPNSLNGGDGIDSCIAGTAVGCEDDSASEPEELAAADRAEEVAQRIEDLAGRGR